MLDLGIQKWWPYEELEISKGNPQERFILSIPWLKTEFEVDLKIAPRVENVIRLIKMGPSSSSLSEVSWLMNLFAHFPIAYVLPRSTFEGEDTSPAKEAELPTGFQWVEQLVSPRFFPEIAAFKWDYEAALGLAQVQEGQYDPITLLTIARRFHLLGSCEQDKTYELYQYVRTLKCFSERFRKACATIVNQNYYVTLKCQETLSPALELSQNARDALSAFIQAEKGHDKILLRSLTELGFFPSQLSIMPTVEDTMKVFKTAAQKNYLAFVNIVDIFERSSYAEQDPLGSLLKEGGFIQAAQQIETHKNINDSGKHETISLDLLSHLRPVSREYAIEALRWTELASNLINRVSAALLEHLRIDK